MSGDPAALGQCVALKFLLPGLSARPDIIVELADAAEYVLQVCEVLERPGHPPQRQPHGARARRRQHPVAGVPAQPGEHEHGARSVLPTRTWPARPGPAAQGPPAEGPPAQGPAYAPVRSGYPPAAQLPPGSRARPRTPCTPVRPPGYGPPPGPAQAPRPTSLHPSTVVLIVLAVLFATGMGGCALCVCIGAAAQP